MLIYSVVTVAMDLHYVYIGPCLFLWAAIHYQYGAVQQSTQMKVKYNTIQLYCLCVEKFAFWLIVYIKHYHHGYHHVSVVALTHCRTYRLTDFPSRGKRAAAAQRYPILYHLEHSTGVRSLSSSACTGQCNLIPYQGN